MARLSAHGIEIARIVVTRDGGETEHVDHFETSYSFRSDGHVLRKLAVVYDPNSADAPRERRHDWGWKLHSKLADPKRDIHARTLALARKHEERLTRLGISFTASYPGA